MLSLSKKKTNKEYIYVKKHNDAQYAVEDVLIKYKKSKDKVKDTVSFYLEKVPFDKLTFIMKMMFYSDGKTILDITKVKSYITQMITEAIEGFIVNPTDASYVSDSIVVMISTYGAKHYLSICPRYDFLK